MKTRIIFPSITDLTIQIPLWTLVNVRNYWNLTECKLNSLMDSHLNDHPYGVFSTKHSETVSFMRTWTGFFVRQYRTRISKRVKPYLDSKKLSLDDWLMSVKQS